MTISHKQPIVNKVTRVLPKQQEKLNIAMNHSNRLKQLNDVRCTKNTRQLLSSVPQRLLSYLIALNHTLVP